MSFIISTPHMTTASHSLWMIEPLCLCTYTFISLHPQTRRPTSGSFNTISAYSDACWGSQLGSLVAGGTLLSLFKFRSMNGGIIFKNGGPIGWLGDRQDRTSLSSCEAKIGATCATSKKVVDFRNLSRSVSDAGYVIPYQKPEYHWSKPLWLPDSFNVYIQSLLFSKKKILFK